MRSDCASRERSRYAPWCTEYGVRSAGSRNEMIVNEKFARQEKGG